MPLTVHLSKRAQFSQGLKKSKGAHSKVLTHRVRIDSPLLLRHYAEKSTFRASMGLASKSKTLSLRRMTSSHKISSSLQLFTENGLKNKGSKVLPSPNSYCANALDTFSNKSFESSGNASNRVKQALILA